MTNRSLSTAVLLSATFMMFMDISIVNVASPNIQRDLGASTGATELVASSYLLAFACVLITAGRLGDQYGYRRLYAIGMAVFTAASGLCALAPDIGTLVGARLLQGIGAGLMAPQVLSIFQTSFSDRQRKSLFAAYSAVIGSACVAGPVLGGLLIGLQIPGVDWRIVFAINVPVGILALCGLHLLPASRPGEAAALDLIGIGLAMAGLALLVFPLAMGHSSHWAPWTIVMIGSAPVVLAFFVWQQMSGERAGRWTVLKLGLVRDPGFRGGLVAVAAFFGGIPPFFFFLSIYVQSGFGYSALAAGLTQVPFAVGNVVGARWSGRLTEWLGRAAPAKAAGLLAVSMLALAVIVALRGAAATPWDLAAPLVLGGVCYGVFSTTAFGYVLSNVPQGASGSASGMLTTVQQAAGSIGLTVGGIVFYLTMPTLPTGASDSIRDAYATGLGHLLIYEVVVFALACTAALMLARRQRATDVSPAVQPASTKSMR